MVGVGQEGPKREGGMPGGAGRPPQAAETGQPRKREDKHVREEGHEQQIVLQKSQIEFLQQQQQLRQLQLIFFY